MGTNKTKLNSFKVQSNLPLEVCTWPDVSNRAEATELAPAFGPLGESPRPLHRPGCEGGVGPLYVATLVPFLFKHRPAHPAEGLESAWPREAL